MSAPALTLFTTMKPFGGEIARIQRNSIMSWLTLKPRPEIIVFGNDPGVTEACREFGLRHVPEVETAPSGAPYLDDLFARAQWLATAHVLCYVNADIMLTSDLLGALDTVSRRLGPAVMACTPHDLVIAHDLVISDPCWERSVRADAARNGVTRYATGADLFMFPRGFYSSLPRLIVGRYYWDNILLWRACFGGLPAVDLTEAVLIVHQRHYQTTHLTPPGYGRGQSVSNPEVARNFARAPWWQRHFWRLDLPLALQSDGSISRRGKIARVAVLLAVTVRQCSAIKIHVLRRTFHLRRSLRLYRWWRQKDNSKLVHGQ